MILLHHGPSSKSGYIKKESKYHSFHCEMSTVTVQQSLLLNNWSTGKYCYVKREFKVNGTL